MTEKTKQKIERVSSFPRDALEQAEVAVSGWDSIGGKLIVPNLSMTQFLHKLEEARLYVVKAEEYKARRARAIQDRNVCLGELWDLTKRVRNAAKATFGDYSDEFERMVNMKK